MNIRVAIVTFCIVLFALLPATAQYTVPLSAPRQGGKVTARIQHVSIRVTGVQDTMVRINVTRNGKVHAPAGLLFDFMESNNQVMVLYKGKEENLLLDIYVPMQFSADLQTTGNGSITGSGLGKRCSARTQKGKIELKDVSGEMSARSHSGNITINNARGNLAVSSFSGRIQVQELAGSALVDNTNDDITLSFSKVSSEFPSAFSNIHGKVEVFFPVDLKANVTIGNFKGKTLCDFELQAVANRKPVPAQLTEVQRQINGGGVDIHFKNLSGSILIRRR
jgi:hypothetical protein